MKDNNDNKFKTVEDILDDPSWANHHDAIRYALNTPFSQLFPKKHELTLMHIVENDTQELFNENPKMSIKKVIMIIFEDLTDDIPAPLMLKLTKRIIEKWQKLTINIQKQSGSVMAV
jgi:methyltransferase-like protein